MGGEDELFRLSEVIYYQIGFIDTPIEKSYMPGYS